MKEQIKNIIESYCEGINHLEFNIADLDKMADEILALQLQQTGVSGSGIIGSRTPSLIKENDCFGCVRRNTDYDCLQCDLPNGYHYR